MNSYSESSKLTQCPHPTLFSFNKEAVTIAPRRLSQEVIKQLLLLQSTHCADAQLSSCRYPNYSALC